MIGSSSWLVRVCLVEYFVCLLYWTNKLVEFIDQLIEWIELLTIKNVKF